MKPVHPLVLRQLRSLPVVMLLSKPGYWPSCCQYFYGDRWRLLADYDYCWSAVVADDSFRASDDALVFTDVTGSLPSLRIGRVIYQDEEYVVKIEKLAIDWRPRDLLNRTLLIEAFTMDTVEFSSAPSDAPLSLPDTLQLPINVVINQLGIRSLRTFTLGIDTPDFSAQQLVLRLIGSDTLYQFPVFRSPSNRASSWAGYRSPRMRHSTCPV